jgi:Zn-dependent M32 family carboxypeptidase
MRIKTKLIALSVLFLLNAGTASASIVADKPSTEKELTEDQKARIEVLKRRVEEIKAIDRSTLSKAERKNIREELKNMNKEAKAMSGKGVYLSIGAIIIIILLLILLL